MRWGEKAKIIFVTLLLGLLLSACLALTLFFGYTYLSANLRVFSALSLIRYSVGWGRFWLILWLGSDVLFFVLVSLILLEIVLFLLRTMLGTALRAHGRMTNRDLSEAVKTLKRWSFITLFRWMGIDDRKKAVLTYVLVILAVFGPGWLGKAVLKATDDLVYRTREQQHLSEETNTVDFSRAIAMGQSYDLRIEAGVGIIHLYTAKDTMEGRFHFLYDTETQKNAFSMIVDEENAEITIAFGDETMYTPYLDPVPSAIEIFLPASLSVDSVSVEVSVSGFLTVSYLDFAEFDLDLKNTQTAFSTEGYEVGTIRLKAEEGTIHLKTGPVDLLHLDLRRAEVLAETGTVTGTVTILSEETHLKWFRTRAANLILNGNRSNLELREVYAPEVEVTLDHSDLIYRNNDSHFTYLHFGLNATASTVSTAGVPYDPQGND